MKNQINKQLFQNRLFSNDFIFLFLKLINYPEKTPGIIEPDQLKRLVFKKLGIKNLLNLLLDLEQDTGLKVKLIKNNYPEIEITKESIEIIWEEIEKHLESFVDGKLIPIDEDYYQFSEQKRYFIAKIEKKLEGKISTTLSLNDNEIENGYRLFESLLILEKQKYLEIKVIYNLNNPKNDNFYRIALEVKNKFLEETGLKEKTKRKRSPKCFLSGNIGFFQIKNSSQKRKIGNANSRHYLLLKFLTRKGVGENVSIDDAYEAIRHGKHYDSKSYEDEKLRALGNANKALQKENKIKPFEIIIDKKTNTIRLS